MYQPDSSKVQLKRKELEQIIQTDAFHNHLNGTFTINSFKVQITDDELKGRARRYGFLVHIRRENNHTRHCWLSRIPEFKGIGAMWAAVSAYADFLRRGGLTFEQSNRVVVDPNHDWNSPDSCIPDEPVKYWNQVDGTYYLIFENPAIAYITPAGPMEDKRVLLTDVNPGREPDVRYVYLGNRRVMAYERWDDQLITLMQEPFGTFIIETLPADTQVVALGVLYSDPYCTHFNIRRSWKKELDVAADIYPDETRGSSISVTYTVGTDEPKVNWYGTSATGETVRNFYSAFGHALDLAFWFKQIKIVR